MYNRRVQNAEVLRAAEMINRFSDKIKTPLYDVIVDTRYETVCDGLETVKLLMQLSSSWSGPVYKLLHIFNEKLSIAKDRIAPRAG